MNDNDSISVLRPERTHVKSSTITVRIPNDLHERMARVRISAHQSGKYFAVTEVVLYALQGACEAAEMELCGSTTK